MLDAAQASEELGEVVDAHLLAARIRYEQYVSICVRNVVRQTRRLSESSRFEEVHQDSHASIPLIEPNEMSGIANDFAVCIRCQRLHFLGDSWRAFDILLPIDKQYRSLKVLQFSTQSIRCRALASAVFDHAIPGSHCSWYSVGLSC